MDLATEGVECKDVGRKPDQEGQDVHRQEQLANQHGVGSRFHKASVNNCKTVKETEQISLETEEYSITKI